MTILAAGVPAGSHAAPDQPSRLTRSVTLPPSARITVEASVGDITIVGWERPNTEVRIEVTAPTTAIRDGVTPVVEQSERGLQVSALQAGDALNRSLKSSIRISTPQTTAFEAVAVLDGRITLTDLLGGVTASCREGTIVASGLQGPIRLETSTGDITLDRATLSERGFIRLRAFNGQVRLAFASRPSDARILALSFNGTIASDIPLATKDRFGPRFGEATLGTGDPVVSIDVVTGDITIKAPPGR